MGSSFVIVGISEATISLYTMTAVTDELPRFAADRMLMRMARWLRLMGIDTIADPSIDGAAILRRARAEGRILLTRDKRLRLAPDAIVLASDHLREQLREVAARFPSIACGARFSRCSRCNAILETAGREAVRRRVPQYVYSSNDRFAVCPHCGRIYWNATHP